MSSTLRFFISCATKEFGSYREDLRGALTSSGREIKIQDDFTDGPGTLLEKLDDYIGGSSAVLHLVGDWAGSKAKPAEVRTILSLYPDLKDVLKEIAGDLYPDTCPFTYTQWEALLAIYHRVPCFIYLADGTSGRDAGYVEDSAEKLAQAIHVLRLKSLGQDRRILPFTDCKDLANRFLNAYLDIAMGIVAETPVAAVTWPAPPATLDYALADREAEFDLFRDLCCGLAARRILFLHGPSDRGKSVLTAEFAKLAASLPPLRSAKAEFKNGLTLGEVLWNLARDLHGIRFPRFDRAFDREATGALPVTFLQDLSESRFPVVLILDAYEQANEDARVWVEDHLLQQVRRSDFLRVVVSGQKAPAPGGTAAWVSHSHWHELPTITDPAHWHRWLTEKRGVTHYDESHLHLLLEATGGSPRPVSSILNQLRPKTC